MSIKEAREKLKLTQNELATKTETTQGTVSKIESDLLAPPLRMVKFIGDQLGTKASHMILNHYSM
jgi:predicted transcriptional regulator